MRLGVVLLAAGRSTRMRRPKMLLPWGQSTVLGHLIEQWSSLGAEQVSTVCAADDQPIQSELNRLGFPAEERIFNPAAERGMFSSIQCAAHWKGWKTGLSHWAIVLGDQPHLSWEILRTILDFASAHPEQICLPRQGGHRRHPVFLPKPLFLELADSSAQDFKDFLDTHTASVAACEIADNALALDLDTPEDYENARRAAGA